MEHILQEQPLVQLQQLQQHFNKRISINNKFLNSYFNKERENKV